jgi:hypothetical protein
MSVEITEIRSDMVACKRGNGAADDMKYGDGRKVARSSRVFLSFLCAATVSADVSFHRTSLSLLRTVRSFYSSRGLSPPEGITSKSLHRKIFYLSIYISTFCPVNS